MSKVTPTANPLDGSAPIKDDTVRGVAPTITVGGQYVPTESVSKLSDLARLFKIRVTTLVVLTAWAGYFLSARKSGATYFSWKLLATLIGVGMVSAGAAALNEVLERAPDARMLRTKNRPLPAGRMSLMEAHLWGWGVTAFGAGLLAWMANPLTGALALVTCLFYGYVYTPLKMRTPHSTLVGAFPGAMPALLGWTAVRGSLEWESLALFAIMFFWQFPHFLAIAWLYREDYERGGIMMLPVVEPDGKSTVRQILFYGLALVPVSLIPFFLNMGGWIYLFGATVLGAVYLVFGFRLALLQQPPTSAASKKEARELIQASVVYLPLLLGLLVLNGAVR
ncbi:MAG: protoheme IX farnesyltransferase [Acidobacteriales bacterium]|nr:protoheme IX farnesyltransferase [Terriglobales bacterium]